MCHRTPAHSPSCLTSPTAATTTVTIVHTLLIHSFGGFLSPPQELLYYTHEEECKVIEKPDDNNTNNNTHKTLDSFAVDFCCYHNCDVVSCSYFALFIVAVGSGEGEVDWELLNLNYRQPNKQATTLATEEEWWHFTLIW